MLAALADPLPVAAEEQVLTGWFHTVAIHRPGAADITEYWLTDDQGARVILLIDASLLAAHGGVRGLDRQRVTVRGHGVPTSGTAAPAVAVLSIELAAAPSSGVGGAPVASLSSTTAAAATVSRPWVTLLCRFGDATNVTPRTVAWFEGLVTSNTYPGMGHYWNEASYGAVSLAGSVVKPWYNLPLPRSAYGSGGMDLDRLAKDCTGAAAADVHFPDFFGINLMFNGDLPVSVGGTWVLTLDGQTRYYAVTWIPSWGFADHALVAHEMGHGFGLPHSSGPYGQTYDSRWDVMSDWADNCRTPHPSYGCVGTGTIAHHKNLAGWIPAARRFVAGPGTTRTVTLDRLALPESSTSYVMAVIPIGSSTTRFYTVEARDLAGYDGQLPARAVIIHRVDTTLSDSDAQVVDVDRNRNPNDAAATWLPGETFSDPENGIRISIVAPEGPGFQVTIASTPPATAGAPDLVVTGLANPPPTAVRGGRFRVSDTVENQGDGAAPASRMRYYLSGTAGRDGTDVRLTGTRTVKALSAGTTATGSTTVTVPSATPPGTYFLLACTDDLGVVEERDETNNCSASATSMTLQAPDLTAIAVSDPPGSAARYARFPVTDSVKNQGSASAAASRVRYYLSRDGARDASDTMLGGSRAIATLAAGATSSGTVTVTVPSSTAGGTYHLLACADALGVVGELVETNNCQASARPVMIGP